MEEELTCGKCQELLTEPLNLPCSHNLCYLCAKTCTIQSDNAIQNARKQKSSNLLINRNLNDRSDCHLDDSGYLAMHEIHACLHQQIQGPISSIKCPKCSVNFILDDRGIDCLPKNLILEGLVEKHKSRNVDIDCQLCEVVPPLKATVSCEQCRVSYCDECLSICHPKRGPLASHSLVTPSHTEQILKIRGVLKCREHEEENISMYCALCKIPVCYLCFEEGRHCGHEAKALGTMYKEQKSELQKGLNELRIKNKDLYEFIQTLATHVDKVQENGVDFESRVVAQIDEVIETLKKKKADLLMSISDNVASKITLLSEQKDKCASTFEATQGLLEYTNEVIKEKDPASFLLISSALSSRLHYNTETWIGKQGLAPAVTSDMELALSTKEVLNAVQNCACAKALPEEKVEIPGIPNIMADNCSVTNNTLTLEWFMSDIMTPIDGYHIEVDDGMNGDFQQVHQTHETACTLGGLQFSSTYRARVQAFNSSGKGNLSDVIYLTTPDVAVFNFDSETSHPDICLNNNNRTMTTNSFENRVALADVGFSRGQHYWEVTIDRYEGNPDPAIGVATEDCMKDTILGKDAKAWSVYVDSTRSWFQHNNAHLFRSEGGIENGSTIGILLDLEHCSLTFYCNEERHGSIAFPSLENVDIVYPAFSLNRNVTMTLYTGLLPPDVE